MHQLAMAVFLAIASTIEGPAIERMLTCRNPVCIKDAYFTLHSPSLAATFFYNARMLQLYPGNRQSELALLHTLPRSEKDADSLEALAQLAIANESARQKRDAICRDLPQIYWRAIRRHRELMPRLIAARHWMDGQFNAEIEEECERAGVPCAERSPLP